MNAQIYFHHSYWTLVGGKWKSRKHAEHCPCDWFNNVSLNGDKRHSNNPIQHSTRNEWKGAQVSSSLFSFFAKHEYPCVGLFMFLHSSEGSGSIGMESARAAFTKSTSTTSQYQYYENDTTTIVFSHAPPSRNFAFGVFHISHDLAFFRMFNSIFPRNFRPRAPEAKTIGSSHHRPTGERWTKVLASIDLAVLVPEQMHDMMIPPTGKKESEQQLSRSFHNRWCSLCICGSKPLHDWRRRNNCSGGCALKRTLLQEKIILRLCRLKILYAKTAIHLLL